MILSKSTLAFSGITLVSRVFGYLRDATVTIVFGASGLTDAFLVAFRVPTPPAARNEQESYRVRAH